MPHTIQQGDTGELAAGAYRALVVHPPGYPLWIWINHFFILLLNKGTIFFRVSLLNIFTSLACLWLIAKNSHHKLFGIFIALTLAFSRIYWKYTELPDVFILNAFFIALLIYTAHTTHAFSFAKLNIKIQNLVPLIFFIALTHHLTFIFLTPVLIATWYINRKDKFFYLLSFFGLVLFITIYLSLFLMNVDHL